MKAWFLQLNQREQLSVLLLGVALSLYILFQAVWSPLQTKRDALLLQNKAVAASLQRVDAMVSQLQGLREGGGAKASSQRNLMSLVNESTTRLQLPVSRLQPNSRGEIQVRLEDAAFGDVLQWLHGLEYTQALLVREVSMTPAGSAGRINATVRVSQAG